MEKILIVDDDKAMCETLMDILSEENYYIDIAHNGHSALQKIKTTKFDLVITDIKMPIMDGMALLQEIEKSNIDLEVIIITSYGHDAQELEASRLGAFEYLKKPLNLNQLKNIVSRALKLRAERIE
ncbi:MAG: response regulator [bacterium]